MVSKRTQYNRDRRAGKVPKKPRGGQPGIPLTERHKEKIRASAILNRLESFVLDEDDKVEMAPHKVSAALGLLSFALPKLQAVHTTDGKEKSHADWVKELQDDEREGPKEEAKD